MFDFRLATVFCLGHRLSKHKMTRYFKNLVGMVPWDPTGYGYDWYQDQPRKTLWNV